LVLLTGAVVAALVVLCLVEARLIFIPLAMAVLITFLLSPLVVSLQRLGLKRLFAVISVVVGMSVLMAGLLWLLAHQVNNLLAELPEYTNKVKAKVEAIQALGRDSTFKGLQQMVREIDHSLDQGTNRPQSIDEAPSQADDRPHAKPVPVIVQGTNDFASMSWWTSYLGSAGEILGGAGLAFVLAVFMLLRREDLRNRFVRLMGLGRITVTTKAVDEAGQRISRYLLMQATINSLYGAGLALGLFLVGVKYALLWGLLAAIMRYVPYIGTWISSLFPITLSLSMFDGWLHTILVVAIILTLELTTYIVVEPRVFGKSMGVSEVALLVSAAFWTFLWGPIGLVLSNPLTVCLVVLGRYIPQLDFLQVLLGDEPVMEPSTIFYQRLLARDQDEAGDIVFQNVKNGSRDSIYDGLLIPALNYTQRDREQDDLTENDETLVLGEIQEIIGMLEDKQSRALTESTQKDLANHTRVPVMCCPARLASDRLALEMLEQLLDPSKYSFEITGDGLLTAELAEYVEKANPGIVCIAALPPGGLAHTRYLCKRVRERCPHMKIMIGRWGLVNNIDQNVNQLKEAGADQIATTLLETREQINAWRPILCHEKIV
jgi:predicted PurR-regulated permease PerM